MTLALVVLVCLFGWALAAVMDRRRDSSSSVNGFRLGAGLAMLACGINLLAYLVPVRWAAWIVVGASAALLVAALLRPTPRESLRHGIGRVSRDIGWAAIPGAVVFLPALTWGLSFTGGFKTDLFQYAQVSALARDNSLFAIQGMTELRGISGEGLGPAIYDGPGITWRAVEALAASALSTVFGLDAVPGLVLLSMVAFIAFAVALLALISRYASGAWARSIVLLALLAPGFGSLFVESYISHFVFVAFIPVAVLGVVSLLPSESPSARGPLWLVLLSAVLGLLVLVYPYFAIVAFAAGLLALALTGFIRRSTLKPLGWAALGTLVAVNFGFLTIINFGETAKYQDGLNAIARNVLLAPYSDSERVGLALGFIPYHWRASEFPASEAMGQPLSTVWSWGLGALEVWWLPLAAVVVAVVGLSLAISWRRSLRDPAFVAGGAVVIAFSLATLALIQRGGDYGALKAAWTASALLPLLLAAAIWRPRRLVWAVMALIPLALFWLRSDVLDRASWFMSPYSVARAAEHSTAVADLDEVRHHLGGVRGEISIRRGAQPLQGSDRDVVLMGHLRALVWDRGIGCSDSCRALPVAEPCPSHKGPVVVIGHTGKESLCGRSRSYNGTFLEIFSRKF